MIRIVTYEGQPAAQLLDRAAEVKRDVTQAVEAIVEKVRLRGDEAVPVSYTHLDVYKRQHICRCRAQPPPPHS